MDQVRSISGNGEDNCGIPEDMRCKRSDGKQWRCSAMSMPDKTVCEKHYIQAKKRAANSALRASLKKAKRKSLGEGDVYLESKSDDLDSSPLLNTPPGDYPVSSSGKKHKDKMSYYSPDTTSTRSLSGRNPINDDLQRDTEDMDMSYKTPLPSTLNRSQRSSDVEHSDGCSGSSDDTEGPMCHQCRRGNRERVVWCLRCDRRGYCDSCISTWYSDIPLEEIERVCPACRGTCNCKVCLRGDNLVKVRIREIPPLDKLQYFHSLLSSVLPVIKQIHHDQCSEVEMERRLRGIETDFERAKLNADEQMCCNLCRIPIIDYHRHCWTCSYDLCLNCCQDLREASTPSVENKIEGRSQDIDKLSEQVKLPRLQVDLSDKFLNWKLNDDGSIMCPPKENGGCGFSSLTLRRIFKLNWVAKLVKNVEEIVSGCRVYDTQSIVTGSKEEDTCNSHLYCPSSQDLKSDGIGDFRKHWTRGEPVIVQAASGNLSISSWDPMVIWREIQEATDEKMKDDNRIVKAIDCLNSCEIEIDLGQFIKGYSEGRMDENSRPKLLKLKDWPSPAASEEFVLYHRPEFVSKLPLLEYIHSKWGLLNVAAKLPHYSLQNDVGPKIFISYGVNEELGCGDSVTNLHFNMRDMVYILVHTCDVKVKGWQRTKVALKKSETEESNGNPETIVDKRERSHNLSLVSQDEATFEDGTCGSDLLKKTGAGATWDVFRRQDVPKLIHYLRVHVEEFQKPFTLQNGPVTHPLHDDEAVFLNRHHKTKLKEEFGVEPWSFEQHLGQAVFIPAGCPFQVRNLQSTVQLGLDFISPESLGEAVRLAEEIRSLSNDHQAKLQMLEVGKISLYAASSAIKEVQKLVLDPKIGSELGFEDPNLTAAVSENLEKMIKGRQIACV